jgi:polyisoprenyl-phosphate glycosyltransferase
VFGIALSGASLLYFVVTVIAIFVKGVPFAGYGTIVSLILLMFGVLFFILGILGQYIAQIYEEVKARPNFIVDREIGLERKQVMAPGPLEWSGAEKPEKEGR